MCHIIPHNFRFLIVFFILINSKLSSGQINVDNLIDFNFLAGQFQYRIDFDNRNVIDKIDKGKLVIFNARTNQPIISKELDTVFAQIDFLKIGTFDTTWVDYKPANLYSYLKFVHGRCEFYYNHSLASGKDTLYLGFYVKENNYDMLFNEENMKSLLSIWKLKKRNGQAEWTVDWFTSIELFELIQIELAQNMKLNSEKRKSVYFSSFNNSNFISKVDSNYCLCEFFEFEKARKLNKFSFDDVPILSYKSIVDLKNSKIKINEFSFYFKNTLGDKGLTSEVSGFSFSIAELKKILPKEYYNIFWTIINSNYRLYGLGCVN